MNILPYFNLNINTQTFGKLNATSAPTENASKNGPILKPLEYDMFCPSTKRVSFAGDSFSKKAEDTLRYYRKMHWISPIAPMKNYYSLQAKRNKEYEDAQKYFAESLTISFARESEKKALVTMGILSKEQMNYLETSKNGNLQATKQINQKITAARQIEGFNETARKELHKLVREKTGWGPGENQSPLQEFLTEEYDWLAVKERDGAEDIATDYHAFIEPLFTYWLPKHCKDPHTKGLDREVADALREVISEDFNNPHSNYGLYRNDTIGKGYEVYTYARRGTVPDSKLASATTTQDEEILDLNSKQYKLALMKTFLATIPIPGESVIIPIEKEQDYPEYGGMKPEDFGYFAG